MIALEKRKVSLAIANPDLAKQWHTTKNGDLTPNDVAEFSHKKVWWQCEKGHEWEAIIANRAKGNGCPFCTGRKVCSDNSLESLHPELSKQWHHTKNNNLLPSDVIAGSVKKVWWQCEKGHEWEAVVHKRVNGRGCPFCSGHKVCDDNSLRVLNPELAKQWHPTKNKNLTPDNVTISSGRKAWWICEKGHEWESVIASRANGCGCPFCSGRSVGDDNSLQALNPDLAKQWHPTKNKNVTPYDVTLGSNKVVWWICGRGHEWKALINNRTKGIGCPICNEGKQTSFPEQAIYFYLKSVFKDALNRYKYNNKWELDIYIPSLNFGIEYDGIYYHQNKEDFDLKKEKYIVGEGVNLLIVKETERGIIKCYRDNNIIYSNKTPSEAQLNAVVEMCFDYISKNVTIQKHNVDIDVGRDRMKIYSAYIEVEEKGSLLANYPELSEQWHPTKNMNIKPNMVKPNSNKKIWWICEKGHEWEALIGNRVKGNGCPFCSGRYVCDNNSLETLNPDVAKQWHTLKNGNLTPKDVTLGTHKKVWWQCEKGHEWEAAVNSRTGGQGCPYCAGRRVCIDNCLQTLNPDLAKQWHPEKNGNFTPNDVTTGSDKKAWWRCLKGHEWEASVVSRVKGNGCPFCSGRRACADNSLRTLNPHLANQWHSTKNGDLTPDDVTMGSGKKVWWQCEQGHEWQATVDKRSKSLGCPHCARQRYSGISE